jgi:predicted transcriptional regulator
VLFGQIRGMAKSDKQPTVKKLSDHDIDQIFTRVGKVLKEKRKQIDISLDDLAYESGVSRSTLTRMLDGEDVNVRNLLKVVYSLNLSIDQVISFKK